MIREIKIPGLAEWVQSVIQPKKEDYYHKQKPTRPLIDPSSVMPIKRGRTIIIVPGKSRIYI